MAGRFRPTDSVSASTARVGVAVGGLVWCAVDVVSTVWPSGTAGERPASPLDALLGRWLAWDGAWYVHIAANGYSYTPRRQSSVAFFPVYPMLARLLGEVVAVGPKVAAIMVTATCGLGAIGLFHLWCRRRLPPGPAYRATVLLATFPYAYFLYGAAYADALFLSLCLGSFLLLENDHPTMAGVVAAVATATRPTGVTLLVGLGAVGLERTRVVRGGPRLRWWVAPAIGVTGIMLWCAYLGVRFGHPFAFIETQSASGWDQAPGLQTWLKHWFFFHLAHDGLLDSFRLVAQAVVTLAFLVTIPSVRRCVGSGYACYALTAVLLPAMSTGDFMGMGRYVLAAFPVFATVGVTVDAGRWRRRLVPAGSGALLILAASLYGAGHILA
jgi:Gpi18-like mannosyltransferase